MTVPYAFANLIGTIALSKLDSNFNTPITIGNTSVQLGNTITTINDITLANVTITSGTSNVTNVNVTNINVTNVTATLANVTTLNVASEYVTASNVATASIGNLTLSNALTVPNGGTGRVTLPVNNVLLGNGTGSIASVAPGNAGNVLTSVGGVWVSNSAVSGVAGGSNGQVQYNNANVLAGSANLTFNGTTLTALAAGVPLFIASTNTNANQLGFSNAANATPQFYIGSPAVNTLQFANGSGVELARINSTGNIVLNGGNAGADGVGVTFPPTQSASTNVNCLDDYEEGTWTPSLGGTATYTAQFGTYTKIGRVVHVSVNLSVLALGTGSATQISGLPFNINLSNNDTGCYIGYVNACASSYVSFSFDNYITYINISAKTAASTGTGGGAAFASGTTINMTMVYIT
jgi:hypothetical protein